MLYLRILLHSPTPGKLPAKKKRKRFCRSVLDASKKKTERRISPMSILDHYRFFQSLLPAHVVYHPGLASPGSILDGKIEPIGSFPYMRALRFP